MYRVAVARLPDGQFYWNLFCDGERVNGGLSPTWADAQHAAADARLAREKPPPWWLA